MNMEGLVACPVCTLYLREGMSLSSHLETHPKEQVIEALVRCMNPETKSLTSCTLHPGHSTIINPFQVVSEEQIFFGRQQVTTNILTPLMTYPIYPQQQVLQSCASPTHQQEQFIQPSLRPALPPSHSPHDEENGRVGEVQSTIANSNSHQGSEILTPLMNVTDPAEFRQDCGDTNPSLPPVELQRVDYEDRKTKLEPVAAAGPVVLDNHGLDDCSSGSRYVEQAPTSVIHTPLDPTNSPPSVITLGSGFSNGGCELKKDQFIATDFQDEDARHSEDFIEDSNHDYADEEESDGMPSNLLEQQRRFYMEEQVDDVEARSDSGLQNIQADECMPAKGELSGHGSVNTAHSWDQDELGIEAIWVGKTEITKRYSCSYCEEEFTCLKERRSHVASIHSSASETKPDLMRADQALMCIRCGLQLPSSKDLKIHVKLEHKKVTRQCSVCLKEFKSQEEYTEHITKIHPLECRTCGKTFKSKASLLGHAKIHLLVKPHPCTLCPKTFITSQKLKEHMNGHTGFAPIQCNMCDKKFKRYSNLKQHKDSVHFQLKKQAKEFFCDCGQTFVSKKKLEWHKEVHDEKPKQCMYCSERYIHTTSLTRHIRRAHNNEYLPAGGGVKKKNVVCPICNLMYVDTSLRAHMKQHGTVKQFGCIVCGKKFFTKWNLHLHRWTHASRMSKPYKCTLCKSSFIRSSDLQCHIRSHFNSKPFTCNHCGMQFTRKQNLSRHEKEHLSEKKHVCNECGKTFHRQYYLVEHMRTHTGAKPYSCHICSKTSSTKSNHNKHIRTHHAREAVNTES